MARTRKKATSRTRLELWAALAACLIAGGCASGGGGGEKADRAGPPPGGLVAASPEKAVEAATIDPGEAADLSPAKIWARTGAAIVESGAPTGVQGDIETALRRLGVAQAGNEPADLTLVARYASEPVEAFSQTDQVVRWTLTVEAIDGRPEWRAVGEARAGRSARGRTIDTLRLDGRAAASGVAIANVIAEKMARRALDERIDLFVKDAASR